MTELDVGWSSSRSSQSLALLSNDSSALHLLPFLLDLPIKAKSVSNGRGLEGGWR